MRGLLKKVRESLDDGGPFDFGGKRFAEWLVNGSPKEEGEDGQ